MGRLGQKLNIEIKCLFKEPYGHAQHIWTLKLCFYKADQSQQVNIYLPVGVLPTSVQFQGTYQPVFVTHSPANAIPGTKNADNILSTKRNLNVKLI